MLLNGNVESLPEKSKFCYNYNNYYLLFFFVHVCFIIDIIPTKLVYR